jgi:tRNA (guanine37-N1)-methyltransferase
MTTFDVITIFPRLFDSFLKESLIARAQKKRLIKIRVHNLRKWAKDRHKTLAEAPPHLAPRAASRRSVVDDRPYGGGLGMVLKVEPIFKAVKELSSLKGRRKTKIILFTPRGKKFNQKLAFQLSKSKQIILICGRYEGVDERVAKHVADIELSMGDYDLMGGELPAMTAIEAVSRLIPGVIAKIRLLRERITKEKGFIEYPQYTRPEVFKPKKGVRWRVPKVLISGHHKKIEEWRKKHGKAIEK